MHENRKNLNIDYSKKKLVTNLFVSIIQPLLRRIQHINKKILISLYMENNVSKRINEKDKHEQFNYNYYSHI